MKTLRGKIEFLPEKRQLRIKRLARKNKKLFRLVNVCGAEQVKGGEG